MSQLHRALLGQIMVAIDPIIEAGLTIVNPAIGVGSRVLLTDVERMMADVSDTAPKPAPPAAPVSQAYPLPAAGTTINSPLPSVDVVQGVDTPAPAPVSEKDANSAVAEEAAAEAHAATATADAKKAPAPAAPAAPAPVAAPAAPAQPTPAAPAPAAAQPALTARDVIEALMRTLQDLEART